MNQILFVPSNSFGGYHVAVEVGKYRNRNLVKLLPNNGYLDIDDFYLLMGVSGEYYLMPILDGKLRIVQADVRWEFAYWLTDPVGRLLKYEDVVSYFDKKKGFKRKE